MLEIWDPMVRRCRRMLVVVMALNWGEIERGKICDEKKIRFLNGQNFTTSDRNQLVDWCAHAIHT